MRCASTNGSASASSDASTPHTASRPEQLARRGRRPRRRRTRARAATRPRRAPRTRASRARPRPRSPRARGRRRAPGARRAAPPRCARRRSPRARDARWRRRRRRPRSRRRRPPPGAGRSWPGAYRRPLPDQGVDGRCVGGRWPRSCGVRRRRRFGHRRWCRPAVTWRAARSRAAWSGWCRRPSSRVPGVRRARRVARVRGRAGRHLRAALGLDGLLGRAVDLLLGDAALRVDELVHLTGEVVGAVHGEVHAVARAHGGRACRSRRAGRTAKVPSVSEKSL